MFTKNLPCCCSSTKRPTRDKLQKLFTEGKHRINKEFDITRIVTALRTLKLLSRKTIKDPIVRLRIQHSDKNIIHLDSGADDGAEE